LVKIAKAASSLDSADLFPLRAKAAPRTSPLRRTIPPRRALEARAALPTVTVVTPATVVAVPRMMVASATDKATTAKVAANIGFMMMI